jgi:hypothetical protein
MRAVESLKETVAGQAAKLAPCGGQERFGTIGPEEAVAGFQCVTNPFSSVARTKLSARLLSRLSPSNLVSKAYEFQQLMSKSANRLR